MGEEAGGGWMRVGEDGGEEGGGGGMVGKDRAVARIFHWSGSTCTRVSARSAESAFCKKGDVEARNRVTRTTDKGRRAISGRSNNI